MVENLPQSAEILMSEQIALAAIFYLNVLEWFLLIMSNEHTRSRSTNLLSSNHLTLYFWLRSEDRKHDLVFLLAACTNSLAGNFPYKYMSCLWSLIWSNRVWGSEYLITWLGITVQSSAMDFWNSYFFKLTLRNDCLELCFRTVAFKTILTQSYYKNTSRIQPRALNTIRRIRRF